MDTGLLVFGLAFAAFVLAAVVKGYLFLAVVQPGLQTRGVPVDEGRLAFRGSVGRYTRDYLALLDEVEQRQPLNRWIARLQWGLPVLGAAMAAAAFFSSWLTGR
ncbi:MULTISPECIES: hypothetical protein [Stenotrophomonas]|uniref:hypothetical protein n=1 Tax=Stenotrophomonas TaxID=40323 RepID=UPI0007700A49|nr:MULTISPECIES: hypothetical protein [Stenotrophomonas]AMJ55557.1 hypothetical protein AXG53_02075 [Stenotrophomonas sp. KCTC 12332]